jgi:hypothetical protein
VREWDSGLDEYDKNRSRIVSVEYIEVDVFRDFSFIFLQNFRGEDRNDLIAEKAIVSFGYRRNDFWRPQEK